MKLEYPTSDQERELLATHCEYFLSDYDNEPQAVLDSKMDSKETQTIYFANLAQRCQFTASNFTWLSRFKFSIGQTRNGRFFIRF